ncbi:MAG: methyltransferase domain-containing protein [Pseudomonadota bacterium]
MTALGHVVEKLIGKAQKAKAQVGTRGGLQPMLSLESQLTMDRIKDLVEESVKKIMTDAIPQLTGQAALEIGDAPALYGPKLLGAQADVVMGVEIGGTFSQKQSDASRGLVIHAKSARLPFPNQKFSYVLGRLATPHQGDMARAISEIGRVLAPGGRGVIIDFHPLGLYAKRGGHRARSIESNIHKIEEYYMLCRKAGLRVVDLREAFIDESTRSLFKDDEIPAYRSLKGTPLLVFLFIYKLKKKT